MTRFSVVLSVTLLSACLTVLGCGGGGAEAPSADEVANFVADNPELMEKTKQSDLVDLDDVDSSEIEEIPND